MLKRKVFSLALMTLLLCFVMPNPILKALSTNNSQADEWNFSKAAELMTYANATSNSVEIVVGVEGMQLESYMKLTELVAKYHGEVVNKVSFGNKVAAVVVNISSVQASQFAEETQTAEASNFIEPNFKFKAEITPNDTYWSSQWGPVKIQANYAWNTTLGSKSVLVAVVDTGIDYTHPDLASNYVSLGYDWVNNDPYPMDDAGHGTHVAGIIAAVINNNFGIAGLAQVSIMAEKGLNSQGSGNEVDLANAIADATDKGAKIISMSWGSSDDSALIHSAVRYAYNHGVLLVAAAGNDASSQKTYPAAYDEAIAVTATDQADNPAYFTNYGDWVELAAPGVSIYSTLLHGSFGYESGTSMATPHVSGVAALIWSVYPNETRDEVRTQLRNTADDLGTAGFDEYYGYGRVNARNALEIVHDVAVTSVSVQKTVVGKGYSADIYVNVTNKGDTPEAFNTTVYANSTIIQTEGVTLNQSASTTLTFTWNTTAFSMGYYILSVYASVVPYETNTSDNNITVGTVTVTIPGDVNGDFIVNLFDVVKISFIYGSELGDPQFRSNSDIDGDGVITIFDVTICTSHYAQKALDE
jgi:subtilisin family serine protease